MTIRFIPLAAIGLCTILGASLTLTSHAQSMQPKVTSKQKETDTTTAEKKADDQKAKVGEMAPDFKLKDATGEEHSLSDFKGKIIVLQWINPGCPVCRHVTSSGKVAAMLKEIRAMDPDVVHLTINSTYWMEPEESAKYLKEHKIDSPALIDREGTVGHLYGAKTTPHMFVIDEDFVLRYDGAFDDNADGSKSSPTNYVTNTVKQIKAGETVSPDQTKPYGCSVKYKKS